MGWGGRIRRKWNERSGGRWNKIRGGRGGGGGGVKRVVKGGRGGEEKLMSGRTQTMKNNFINNPEIQGPTRK